MRRKGFTLIELLVVIAIIAILAAILFPVFATAKERARQTACTANHKNWGTAFNLYIGDWDDRFPTSITRRQDASCSNWFGNMHHVPAQARASTLSWCQVIATETHYANSVQPYLANWQVYSCPSSSVFPTAFNLEHSGAATDVEPRRMSYQYNGMLSYYPQAGISSPSTLPIMWEGFGRHSFKGFGVGSPTLNCEGLAANSPCMFNPSGAPHVNAAQPFGPALSLGPQNPSNFWLHNRGVIFTMSDSSAKWRRLGTNGDPNGVPGVPSTPQYENDTFRDPWIWYDSSGNSLGFYRSDALGYAYLFRPNYIPPF